MASLLNMSGGRLLEKLPYDAEIEYLEVGSTPANYYIQLDIYGRPNMIVEGDFKFVRSGSQYHFLGMRATSGDTRFHPVNITPNGHYEISFGTWYSTSVDMITSSMTHWKITMTSSLVSIEKNGSSVLSKSGTYSINTSSPYKMGLFQSNYYGTPTLPSPTGTRVGAFSIKQNGVLVGDFIPVRVGNVGYMYDKVSKKLFGNSGTGRFILGPDCYYNGIYDAEIEYLESDGSQFIRTGFIPDNTSGMFIKAMATQSMGNGIVAGSREGDVRWLINFSGGNIEFSWNDWRGYTYDYSGNVVEIEHNFMNERLGKINTVVYRREYPVLGNNTKEVYLFVGNVNGEASVPFIGRIYNVKFSREDNIIMDLIPVRRGSRGCMYDKVSGQVFYNQSTGGFILGPDK